MDAVTIFKSLVTIETINLREKENFVNRLLKGWRGEFEFYNLAKNQGVQFIEGPWILRPTKEPIRFLLYFHPENVKSFPKELLNLKSSYLKPFVLTFSIMDKTVPYPPLWHVTATGVWKISTERPQVLSVRYEIYDQNLSHIGTIDNNDAQLFKNPPFNFRCSKQRRFSRYDDQYVNNITLSEGKTLQGEFLETLYAKRFFISYPAASFSFIETEDLDAILLHNNNKFIIEIKEKFPIPDTGEFGWDAHRMVPYFFFAKEMDAKVIYCIREVASEIDRSFKDWKLIDLDKFLLYANFAAAITGGTGGFVKGQRTTTLQTPASEFYSLNKEGDLKKILNNIL